MAKGRERISKGELKKRNNFETIYMVRLMLESRGESRSHKKIDVEWMKARGKNGIRYPTIPSCQLCTPVMEIVLTIRDNANALSVPPCEYGGNTEIEITSRS
jgi:hypothetical protein